MAKFLGMTQQEKDAPAPTFAFTWEEVEAIGDALRIAGAKAGTSDELIAVHEALTAAVDVRYADGAVEAEAAKLGGLP